MWWRGRESEDGDFEDTFAKDEVSVLCRYQFVISLWFNNAVNYARAICVYLSPPLFSM